MKNFCIYGIELDYNAIKKAVKKLYKEDLLEDEVNENLICKLIEGTILELHFDQWEGHYVGRNWLSIKDDETGLQFKTSTEDDIAKVFGRIAAARVNSIEKVWQG
jgi:hypothetical protein